MISASSRGGLYAHQFQRCLRAGVNLGRPADDPDRHGHLERADQIAVRIPAPGGKAGVAPRAGGVRMRAGFDRAPVVAGGDHHRVDAVHDALVVRGGAVGVGGGECPGGDDPIPHLFAAEICQKPAWKPGCVHLRPRQAFIGQVGEDAQEHPPAGDASRPAESAFPRRC